MTGQKYHSHTEMTGQKYRSHTGLERTVMGYAKRSDATPTLIVFEEHRGEFAMTVSNFKRWLKERRCVLIDNGARQ